MRGFADRGGTVLLSIHLLHEIEVIADDLVVIGTTHVDGSLFLQLTADDARDHDHPHDSRKQAAA